MNAIITLITAGVLVIGASSFLPGSGGSGGWDSNCEISEDGFRICHAE